MPVETASCASGCQQRPRALRPSVVRDYLFLAEFTLSAFAPKAAARCDTYATASCPTRAVNELVLALFALNRKYPVNDKTALAEAAEFERAPRNFLALVQQTLVNLGASSPDLAAAVENITQLFHDAVQLAAELYQPYFVLPGKERGAGPRAVT